MLRRGDACFRNEVIDATYFAAKTWQSDQFEWPTGGIEMKIAFDIGGVLGKHPKVFRPLVCALRSGGVEVYVLTDIPDQASAERVLRKHGYDFRPKTSCVAIISGTVTVARA